MKRFIYSLTIAVLITSCTNGQQNKPTETKMMDDFELTPEKAHPKAKALLTEEFYWSPIDETGPFGSDDGSDSFYQFRQWRVDNKKVSPATFLKELLDEWGFPSFDIGKTDVKELLTKVDAGMIIVQDNAIIAIGFGQFVLEGKIDNDIKDLTKKAIQREMADELLVHFRSDYRQVRKDQLTRMLVVVDKMNQ
ncbi:MAG: hypothetical protein ABI663_21235 [Chryseolinea sp.]